MFGFFDKNKLQKIDVKGNGQTIFLVQNDSKKNIGVNPKIIRRKLDKFDLKKSSGTYKKIFRYLNLKKSNFTKLENGLIKTIDSMK